MLRKLVYRLVSRYYLRKPDWAEFMETRYGSWRSIYYNVLNQMCFLMGLPYAPKITSLQFELTNTCNLNCKMCPVNRGMKRKRGFMNYRLFKRVVDQNPKAEFALLFNWGEPLLHPDVFRMARYLHSKGIRPFLTTNAVLLDNEKTDKLLTCGIDRITISLDGCNESYERVRGVNYPNVEAAIERLLRRRKELKSKTRVDVSMVVFKDTEPYVNDFVRKWRPRVDRLQLQPCLDFNARRKTVCKEPWRGNIVILWDGRVTVCCVDYEGHMIIGDANKQSLRDIWNGRAIRMIRRMHLKKNFKGVCERCGEYETGYVDSRFD